jgi:hypothetical protein
MPLAAIKIDFTYLDNIWLSSFKLRVWLACILIDTLFNIFCLFLQTKLGKYQYLSES